MKLNMLATPHTVGFISIENNIKLYIVLLFSFKKIHCRTLQKEIKMK